MKKTNLLLSSRYFLLTFCLIACSNQAALKPAQPAPTAEQKLALEIEQSVQNSPSLDSILKACQVIPLKGATLPDGKSVDSVLLDNPYFGKADESVYIVGDFPKDYPSEMVSDETPSRAEILKNATAWKWTISPKQDKNGKWSLLSLYKQIYVAANKKAYLIDSKDVQYGQAFDLNDKDGNIKMHCSLPNAQ
jgi:hypothetical protein